MSIVELERVIRLKFNLEDSFKANYLFLQGVFYRIHHLDKDNSRVFIFGEHGIEVLNISPLMKFTIGDIMLNHVIEVCDQSEIQDKILMFWDTQSHYLKDQDQRFISYLSHILI